ncbi:hypothetical protein GIB67_032492 [Kingdonia uniflora]|uniref:Uncharacterized protein n=1 Tax=Kingdonia uniflora TaxID=39325 RepID=A0A7J7L7T0_9MAGN|nr:hypothetical protein GIB67_032492 [Kingdonia uniflora]
MLENQEFLGYIDGAIASPSLAISNEEGLSEENLEYRKWRLADHFVTSLINSSLTEEIMTETMGTNHAKRFKKIYDQLAAIGTPVPDHKKVYWLLHGLGHEYHNYVTTTLCKPPYPPFKEVVSSLLSHELFLKSLSPPIEPHESTFSAQRGGHGRRDNRGGRSSCGYYSYRGGSYSRATNTNHGHESYRSFNRSNYRGPQCQIYNRTGHSIINCYNYVNKSAQSTDI